MNEYNLLVHHDLVNDPPTVYQCLIRNAVLIRGNVEVI